MNDRNRMFYEAAPVNRNEQRWPAADRSGAELVFEDGPNVTDYETDAWEVICT